MIKIIQTNVLVDEQNEVDADRTNQQNEEMAEVIKGHNDGDLDNSVIVKNNNLEEFIERCRNFELLVGKPLIFVEPVKQVQRNTVFNRILVRVVRRRRHFNSDIYIITSFPNRIDAHIKIVWDVIERYHALDKYYKPKE